MNKKEEQRLVQWLKNELGEDSDTFDLESEQDLSLTYEENITILAAKIKPLKEGIELKRAKEEYETQSERAKNEFVNEMKKDEAPKQDMFTDQTNTLIIGKKGSGKTCYGWTHAFNVAKRSGRKVYVLEHPRPEVLKKLPFEVTNVISINRMNTITDGVVIIDEAHRKFDVLNKQVNEQLRTILSNSRQNNTDFIFICHNSYFVTRGLFSFIDIKVIKEVNQDHWALERPHMAMLYKDTSVYGAKNFYIDSDYVKGYQQFERPDWFTEELSTSYRTQIIKKDFFA